MKRMPKTKIETSSLFGLVRNFVHAKKKTSVELKGTLAQSQIWDFSETSRAGRVFYAEAEIGRSQGMIEASRHCLR